MIRSTQRLPAIQQEQPVYTITAPEEEATAVGISTAQVLSILRAYRMHSLIIFVVLTGVFALGIKLMPKSFVSVATLLVNVNNKDPLADRQVDPAEGHNFIATQLELITSRAVLQPVAAKLNLAQNKNYTQGYKGPAGGLTEVVNKNLRDSVQVQQQAQGQQGVTSQVIYISATAREPALAADIANGVAEEYLRQQRQRTNAQAERYEKQLKELQDQVNTAQTRLTDFRQQHGITDVDTARVGLADASLADLQEKLQNAQNQRRMLESHQLDAHANSNAALDSTAVATLRATLASQESQMAELRTTLGPKHPKVIELASQMEATRKSLALEVESISANDAVQLQQARDLESKYQAAVNASRTQVLTVHGVEDQTAKLVLELQSAQATYKKALDGYDEIKFTSAANYNDLSLVSRAEPPVKPDKPNKVQFFAMACLAALAFALVGPFGFELFMNRRVRCRDDIERHFNIPVLAQFGAIAELNR